MENAKFVASKNHVSADLMGEAVILDTNTGVYYGLNPVGTRVWELIQQQPASLNQICATILDEYDVPPAVCERDVRALLQRLTETGLAEMVE